MLLALTLGARTLYVGYPLFIGFHCVYETGTPIARAVIARRSTTRSGGDSHRCQYFALLWMRSMPGDRFLLAFAINNATSLLVQVILQCLSRCTRQAFSPTFSRQWCYTQHRHRFAFFTSHSHAVFLASLSFSSSTSPTATFVCAATGPSGDKLARAIPYHFSSRRHGTVLPSPVKAVMAMATTKMLHSHHPVPAAVTLQLTSPPACQ